MTVKEIAKDVINALPDESSIDDILHALYITAKFKKGEQEIKEGKGISHEEAQGRLS